MNITINIPDDEMLKFFDFFNNYLNLKRNKFETDLSNKPIELIKSKLSVRLYNILSVNGFVYIKDILNFNLDYFLRLKGFGRLCYRELEQLINSLGLEFNRSKINNLI